MSDLIINTPDLPEEPEHVETPPEVTVEAPPETPEEQPARTVTEYEKQLRDENAEYRQRWQPYERALSSYEEEEREAWLTLMEMANSDDPEQQQTARDFMLQMAGANQQPADQPQYMTAAEVDRLVNERLGAFESQRAEEQAVNEVVSEAEKLGYKRDSEDYILLLHYANQMDAPDLAEADKAVKAYRQQAIDAYLAERGQDATHSPQIPSGAGVPPSLVHTPKDWKEARAAAEERFARIPTE